MIWFLNLCFAGFGAFFWVGHGAQQLKAADPTMRYADGSFVIVARRIFCWPKTLKEVRSDVGTG